jgi:hypothetical protein
MTWAHYLAAAIGGAMLFAWLHWHEWRELRAVLRALPYLSAGFGAGVGVGVGVRSALTPPRGVAVDRPDLGPANPSPPRGELIAPLDAARGYRAQVPDDG